MLFDFLPIAGNGNRTEQSRNAGLLVPTVPQPDTLSPAPSLTAARRQVTPPSRASIQGHTGTQPAPDAGARALGDRTNRD
ncbi:MAG: hypothetical protein KME26_00855 [Oscillatoria princeps RMCB-10]|nr:hypothetical protein [Oscillatoria princeps RMCB-10]